MATAVSTLSKLKIVLGGNSKTGKDCYVTRLLHDKYSPDSPNNKDCDRSSVKVNIDGDTHAVVEIFNIRGAELGRTSLKKYLRDIHGYIIMFDVTEPETYDYVTTWKKWIDNQNQSKKLPCIVLANKCDLEKHEQIADQMETLNSYCQLFGFSAYFETSAKNNMSIQQSFEYLIREILQPSSSASTPEIVDTTDIPPIPAIPQEYTIKIIVIGEINTGKTAIIQQYTKNKFSGRYRSTIGTDLALKKIHYRNDLINLHIWDIAGDERFGAMTHLFYKDAAGCLIVFDVSKSRTLEGTVRWKDDFDTKVNYDKNIPIPCVLVGNKCDLPKDGLVMSEKEMDNFCRTHKLSRWFETSAKENINITETFEFLVDQIMQNVINRPGVRTRTSSETIRIDEDFEILPKHRTLTCCDN